MKLYNIAELNGKYALVEKSTGHVVDYYTDRSEARKKLNFMSSGGAFNGFTPNFICLSTHSKENLTLMAHTTTQADSDFDLDISFLKHLDPIHQQ